MKACISILVFISAASGGGWAQCLNFTNYKITFQSRNFECIWKWDQENKLPPGTLYSVQYKKYGIIQWNDKSECQNTSAKFCNLTREMTKDTENVNYDEYVIRVKAQSKNCTSFWVQSKRISVKDYTVIGPPLLSYVSNIYSIKFTVKPPQAFIQSKDGSLQTIEVFYNTPIEYHLSISSRDARTLLSFVQKNQEFEVSGLEPDTVYNGTVHMFLETGKNSEGSAFLVRTLPGNVWAFVVAGVFISILLLSLATLWLSYKYVHRASGHLPKSLDTRVFARSHTMNLSLNENTTSYIHGFSRPSFSTSKAKLNLSESLSQSPILCGQDGQYKSQVSRSTSNSSALSSEQGNLTPVSYLSQETQTSSLDSGSKNSSITYGVWAEERTSARNSVLLTNPIHESIVQWDSNPAYRSQAEPLPTCQMQSTPSWTACALEPSMAPRAENGATELSFESDQLFQRPGLQQEKIQDGACLLFPFLAGDHPLVSNQDLGRYRPQETISFSLLSSVRVADSELDGTQFLLHPREEEGLADDDHLVGDTLQTLSEAEPLSCQYRANDVKL